ncbi:DNA polymerase alpha subunit B [Exaiptasia diaphana]|uniref:DNA polymerase alpha subunit B n=1 Tax=Exaiptasia diaphana TaxID=2652724 RepID=A0A913WUG9_EXADI|nr:DNA polymerase alpha subunit B [Exaiptasia diaphana]KXJ17723.1 DNA polymerase alpha subunit B [Exaiptasia diaphana]
MVTDEEIEQEFGEFSIKIDDVAILDKLKDICTDCQLTPEDLVSEWVAFAQTSKLENNDIKVELLEEFERKQSFERNKKLQTQFSKHEGSSRMVTKDDLDDYINEEDAEDMLDMYCQTPRNKKSLKRALTTPEAPNNKRHTTLSRTPGPNTAFSPSSFSPAMATPSVKYGSRHNAGDVVCSFGSATSNWKGTGAALRITHADEEIALTEKFRYMFQKQADKANVLNDMIDEMAEKLQKEHGIEEFADMTSSSQVDVNVVGRVCCDSVGKLNASSLMLEGSLDLCQGQQVKVDLSNVQQFALFPGQIIAARGLNSTGQKLVINQIYKGTQLPFYSSLDKNGKTLHKTSDPFTMMVAAGPFTTTDSLMYEPLTDLINVAQKDKPDVLVLLGPFVDAKHDKIENGDLEETYEELFKRQVGGILKALEKQQTTVVFVPSQRDVHHDFVYPQPPFLIDGYQDNKNVHFVSDPCTLLINNVAIGLTSTDILLNLGSEETASPPGASDRLGRLVKHILYQHSYYPLHPPSEEVNMDYEKYSAYSFFSCTPDILILPSDLRYFTKDVLGGLCVNPGRLTKGQVGGTYARLHVKPDSTHTDISMSHVLQNSSAQVVRI